MALSIDEVRWLLAHLYDNAALAGTALFARLPGLDGAEPQGRVNALRTLLLDAIEFLRPPRRESLRSTAARSYAVLWLRYVEGMSIPQVAEELALSERQTHRELREAEAKLTEVLGANLDILGRSPAVPQTGEQEPIGKFTAKSAMVEVQQALSAALQMVRPLAQHLGVTVTLDSDLLSGRAYLDEGVLRQLFTQALSLAVQNTEGEMVVRAQPESAAVHLSISFQTRNQALDADMVAGVERLAHAIGVECQVGQVGAAAHVDLTIPLRQPRTILVVEDSPGAVELFRRYLEPSGEWRVVAVPEPRLTYDMARSLQPALIVLDLLMPGTDGWSILNLLHAHEQTSDIPVVVCSVFQDPLLAEALGAKAYLRKPVSQLQLLSTVRRWARP